MSDLKDKKEQENSVEIVRFEKDLEYHKLDVDILQTSFKEPGILSLKQEIYDILINKPITATYSDNTYLAKQLIEVLEKQFVYTQLK